jgi:hypothetical protein
MTNAIVMLCMLKYHYVLGACISAYTHRSFIHNDDVELVIMCDDIIYNKYKDLLQHYFDKVIKIDLIEFPRALSYNYKFVSETGKYDWITKSLSKWQCLSLTDYDKILFIDIDIIPIRKNFYNILNLNAPTVSVYYRLDINSTIYKDMDTVKQYYERDNIFNRFNTYKEYIDNSSHLYSIDGGLVLLKPDMNLYNKYIKFINKTYKNGIYSMMLSGPDETSLFYFLIKEEKYPLVLIDSKYSIIPWENDKNIIKEAYAYNFLSNVKPWLKTKITSWPEELIWRLLYINIPHYGSIEDLNKKVITKYFIDFYNKKNKDHYDKYYYKKNKNKFNELKNILKNNVTTMDDKFNEIKKLEKQLYKFKGFGLLNKRYIIKVVNNIRRLKKLTL